MPRKPTFTPEPRILTAWQVATRLGKSVGWLNQNLDALGRIGFPRRDEFFQGWDSNAIEAWLDRRAGLAHHGETETGEWFAAIGAS